MMVANFDLVAGTMNYGKRDVLLVAHGLAEHLGRYESIGNSLVRTRLGVSNRSQNFGGHGESDGRRGPRRYVDLDMLRITALS